MDDLVKQARSVPAIRQLAGRVKANEQENGK